MSDIAPLSRRTLARSLLIAVDVLVIALSWSTFVTVANLRPQWTSIALAVAALYTALAAASLTLLLSGGGRRAHAAAGPPAAPVRVAGSGATTIAGPAAIATAAPAARSERSQDGAGAGAGTGAGAAAPLPAELVDALTPQELRVVTLVSRGLSNRRVGDELFISVATVKSHVYNIYRKLGIRNRWELIHRCAAPLSAAQRTAAATVRKLEPEPAELSRR